MWTVVYITSNKDTAEELKKMLTNEGMLVMLRVNGSINLNDSSIELMVPESEAEEAHEIISSLAFKLS